MKAALLFGGNEVHVIELVFARTTYLGLLPVGRQAEGGADGGEGNGGLGGAILNVGGEVRFYGEAEFYHNKAKVGGRDPVLQCRGPSSEYWMSTIFAINQICRGRCWW